VGKDVVVYVYNYSMMVDNVTQGSWRVTTPRRAHLLPFRGYQRSLRESDDVTRPTRHYPPVETAPPAGRTNNPAGEMRRTGQPPHRRRVLSEYIRARRECFCGGGGGTQRTEKGFCGAH